MNTPAPAPPIVNTLPSIGATASATAASTLLGYGASLLATKYSIPFEVVGSLLGLLCTGLTSLWHRFMPTAPGH